MRWFGEDWGAPVCEEAEHVDTPVDNQCLYCPHPIDEGDVGFEMPYLGRAGRISVVFAHRDCLLRVILPEDFHPRVHPPV